MMDTRVQVPVTILDVYVQEVDTSAHGCRQTKWPVLLAKRREQRTQLPLGSIPGEEQPVLVPSEERSSRSSTKKGRRRRRRRRRSIYLPNSSPMSRVSAESVFCQR